MAKKPKQKKPTTLEVLTAIATIVSQMILAIAALIEVLKTQQANQRGAQAPPPKGGIYIISQEKEKINSFMKNTWLFILCALLLIVTIVGWTIPMRILVGITATAILVNCIIELWRMRNGKKNDTK